MQSIFCDALYKVLVINIIPKLHVQNTISATITPQKERKKTKQEVICMYGD